MAEGWRCAATIGGAYAVFAALTWVATRLFNTDKAVIAVIIGFACHWLNRFGVACALSAKCFVYSTALRT